MDIWGQIVEYFKTDGRAYLLLIGQHSGISALALALAVLIGVSAGVLCVRHKALGKYILSLFQVLRIVPSLAVLLLLLPVLGTGVLPALVALVLLGIPPVMMNTVAGLDDVPAFMLETADGLGMTPAQVWRKVRFPLALPMLFSGVKTAAVEIIASATLAAKIGAGGLGEMIFTGFGLYRLDLLLIGGVTVAGLSLVSGFLIHGLDRAVLRYKYIGANA